MIRCLGFGWIWQAQTECVHCHHTWLESADPKYVFNFLYFMFLIVFEHSALFAFLSSHLLQKCESARQIQAFAAQIPRYGLSDQILWQHRALQLIGHWFIYPWQNHWMPLDASAVFIMDMVPSLSVCLSGLRVRHLQLRFDQTHMHAKHHKAILHILITCGKSQMI